MRLFFTYVLLFTFSPIILFSQTTLKAKKDSCLVEVTVSDIKDKPIILADLIVITNPQKDVVKVKTDRKGKAYFLLPQKGRQNFEFKIDYRGDKHEFDRLFKIPQDGDYYELEVKLKYEPKHIVLAEVQFETNKSDILASAHQELLDVVELMNLKTAMEIEVLGHTDSIGDKDKNIKLSLDRANAVKNYLVEQGVSSSRIKTSGHGPLIPIADNSTAEGRAINRRIEIKVIKE